MTRTRILTSALAIGLLVLIGAPSPAQAQGFDPALMRERALTDIDETMKALALEGEKADTVRAILIAAVDKRFEMLSRMRSQGGQPGGGMREAMTALNEETEKQLAEFLTTVELAKYRQIQAERRPAGGAGRRPPGS